MKKILAVAVATAISAPAMADLTIGASTEYNYETVGGAAATSIETNLDFTGTSTSESGVTVKAYAQLELNDTAGVDVDDNNLTISTDMVSVTVGEFGSADAFIVGDDSWAPAASVAAGFTAEVLDDNGDQDIRVALTPAAGLTVAATGNLENGDAANYRLYAQYATGAFTVTANRDEVKGNDDLSGYAVSLSLPLDVATVGLSFAANDAADDTSTAVNVAYGAFNATLRANTAAADADETVVYGSYNVGGFGVPGLNVDLGAGFSNETDTETEMGVEVTYAF